MTLLSGKTVMVTGGASGIGRAICHVLAMQGAKAILVADLQPDPQEGGASVEELVTEAGAAFAFHRTDVRKKHEIEAAVAAAQAYGGLDVMVCNAGIASANDGIDLSEAEYARLIEININGVFFSAQIAAHQMIERGTGGSIVIISSMGGVRGSSATTVYSATKGAGRLLAASLADSLGPHGIRVNAVCPGLIETALAKSNPAVAAKMAGMLQRTPLRRMGQPAEIGAVVAWLASDLASYVTGTSIIADGGLTAVI